MSADLNFNMPQGVRKNAVKQLIVVSVASYNLELIGLQILQVLARLLRPCLNLLDSLPQL